MQDELTSNIDRNRNGPSAINWPCCINNSVLTDCIAFLPAENSNVKIAPNGKIKLF
jgi:hypothetical protein